MPDDERSEIVVVFGKRGVGKTTYLRHCIADAYKADVDVWAIDPKAQLLDLVPDAWTLLDLDTVQDPGPGLLVIDEVDLVAGNGQMHPRIRNWLHYSRHMGLTIVCCARRVANVHRDLTALADRAICFRTTEPRDLETLAKWLDFDVESLKTLAVGQYAEVAL